ncbi:MAG: thiamine pyrophosphate-binding protein [Rhodospirillaceae bacterium]|nr:thiamine pyrophosphate-binding protein [Rhodospirillaceae bacterium]
MSEGEERPVQGGQFEMGWGSDVIAQMLRDFGIDYITLNPGASYRGFHDSLVNYLGNRDPQMLVAMHEEHAVAIAHGYAKVTDKPMAVAVHSNVGLMHATMAIFNAWCDRVPMLILGATGPVDAAQRRPWIEWIHTAKDQGALIRDYVKWDDQPGSPEAAVESMLRAWQITRTAPNGPVYVCMDLGVQEQQFDVPIAIPDVGRYEPGGDPAPAPADLARAVELLANAERPLILAGKGSRDADAWADRIRLAERLDARVLTDLKAGAAFPTDHALHPLPPIKRPSKAACAMIAEADMILALEWIDLAGTFKQALGQTESEATLINCTVDSYLHNGWSMDHHILPAADIRLLCRPDSLVPALLEALGEGDRQAAWGTIEAEPPERSGGDALDYQDIADALTAALGDRKSTITGVPIGWPGYAWPINEPLDYLGGDGGAGIGSGPGIAIGAALALKGSGRVPVAILGDGDTTMGINALWTAAKYRIPLLIVVANNRSYFNDELHQERIARTRSRPEENRWIGQRLEDPVPDIPALARGFGWAASDAVATKDDLTQAMTDAVATVAAGGQALVDVHIMRGYDPTVVNPGGMDKSG